MIFYKNQTVHSYNYDVYNMYFKIDLRKKKYLVSFIFHESNQEYSLIKSPKMFCFYPFLTTDSTKYLRHYMVHTIGDRIIESLQTLYE